MAKNHAKLVAFKEQVPYSQHSIFFLTYELAH